MKVLFASGEGWPFVKTGGLGDVAYSLPKFLKKSGVDVRVVLPKYESIDKKYRGKMKNLGHTYISLGWRNQYCGVETLTHEGVTYYFIDSKFYFDRPNTYGEGDDCERFSFYSKAVIQLLDVVGFTPDLIHCNDWHTGLVPLYLKELQRNGIYEDVKTLFTIHNLKYQGVFSRETLGDIIPLPYDVYFREDALKYYDSISFMKGGINFADMVSTVSDTYAKEITSEYYGEGLHGLLGSNKDKLFGVINGIDYDLFNPRTDKEIAVKYSQSKIEKKVENKKALQKELGLPVDGSIPVVGIITRLVKQKGIDLIAHMMKEILSQNLQLVLLGNGDTDYEDMFRYFAKKYPEKLSANIKFDHGLAKRIYVGSDLFLMPSKFEPCGLSQMISMRYGTVPVVRATGGLKDTVTEYNKKKKEGTGFTFENYNAHDMYTALMKGVNLYIEDKKEFDEISVRGMKEKNSWTQVSKEYKNWYKKIISGKASKEIAKAEKKVEAASKKKEEKKKVVKKKEAKKKVEKK